jgi:hypothetical protein
MTDMDPANETPPAAPPATDGAAPAAVNRQAVTGVVPPQLAEARIREAWPSVTARGAGLPRLARALMRSIVLAPLGWLLLAPLFALRIAPFVCKRYTLTNRRVMVQRGWKPAPVKEVPLADVEDVRLVEDTRDDFYRSATLEVVSKGQVVMTLPGVPEPEGFRRAVLNAVAAWVPGKSAGAFVPASAVKV